MSDGPYSDSRTLLAALAKKDRSFAWAPVFKAAAVQTNAKALAASSGPTLREVRIEFAEGMIESGVFLTLVGGTVGAMLGMFAMEIFATTSVLSFSLGFFFGGIGVLALVTGVFQHVLARSRRKDNRNIVFPSLVAIEPTVPSPIRYKLRSALGPEGELLAYLTRYTPEIVEGRLQENVGKFAAIHLGNDEDANELSENFETLLASVKELEREAARPYTLILIDNGLAEEQLPTTKAKLQDRVEKARERLQLNSGIVSSLNKQEQSASDESPYETAAETHQQLAFETV